MNSSFHYPPTEEEARDFYVELPSCPRLVARSSTYHWTPPQDHYTVLKTVDTVGAHPIVNLWNDSNGPMRREIMKTVKEINWTVVDILRVGFVRQTPTFNKSAEKPVTLLISVQPKSTSWQAGIDVAIKCRRILELYGIQDIEVEVLEAWVSNCHSTTSKLVSEKIIEPTTASAQLSEFIGTSIAGMNLPHEGTKGVYLRLGREGKVVALTCRHVVFSDESENIDYHYDQNNIISVLQPGRTTLESSVAIVQTEIKYSLLDLQKYTTRNYMREAASEESKLQDLKELEERLEHLKDDDTRVIGHVLFSPKYSLGPSTNQGGKRLRDWALIELHPDKHRTPLQNLQNQTIAGSRGRQELDMALDAELKRDKQEALGVQLDFDIWTNTFNLKGTVPEDEMRHPALQVCQSDENVMIVGKFGRSSGLTFGLVNEVKSVQRTFAGNEWSEEWCIVGHRRKKVDQTRTDFTKRGDSGSCIFDLKGRIAGMVTGGRETGAGVHDITYATPIDWLLDDIRSYGFEVELV
ncbi:hypothetical protein F53441_14547 [Fusarium austroafricanum]|uniref:Uncharacterized protein n=1 Tax=Fusarium austroafricanum TaxID=2364996 RepID=A0A8H4NBM8_9HYPO|nr:hypothetical protein F53441_14547 [Fusarium austroafricanum]